MPTVPAAWTGECRTRTDAGVCAHRVRVPLTAEPMAGYRPARWRVRGTAVCEAGHTVHIDREYTPTDGAAVAREIHGGLPGLGKQH